MIFFEFEQVTRIHSSLIAKTGGLDGIRDKNLLDSALKVPFQTFDGKDLYPDILDKATQLCFSLINNHPFSDGNKRIGIHLTLLFLKINNVQLNYVQQELIDLGFGIASSKLQKNDIRKWFENHVVGQY
jgi:death-on-curing protein